MNKNLKIMLVCIVNSNYGDGIIADCTEYLIKKALGKKAKYSTVLRYKIDSEDLWQIQFTDAVVFAGGGLLKFKQEKFYNHLCNIIEEAQRCGVPVFMNSVGVEGFDDQDERFVMLKNYVNYDCVKGITIRDDIVLMTDKYKERSDLRVKGVFDPAVWAKDVYEKSMHDNGIVGINVARGDLFPDYGNSELDEDFMLSFWSDMIKLLEDKGYNWKVFTNGAKGDEAFANKLMTKIGHGEKLPPPLNSEMLVENISSFEAIIALRMHACITSYSLGIPCIGLVWNNKLRLWSEKIKTPEFYISPDNINAENVFNTFLEAKEKSVRKLGYFKKNAVYFELKRFLSKYAKNRNVSGADISDKVFEVGLGGIQHRYKAPNSLDELERRLQEGCRFFEADIRADVEGKPVCINGWSEKNLRMLGIDIQSDKPKGVALNEFKTKLLDGKFRMGGFDEAAEILSKYKGVRIILDVGVPPASLKEPLFENIAAILKSYKMDNDRTFIRLQSEGDVKLWRKQNCPSRIIYFFPESRSTEDCKAKQEKALSVCKKYGIVLISISEKNFTEENSQILKDNKLSPVVFSYEKLGDAASAFERGAHFVGTCYYSSCYYKRLTESLVKEK